MNKIYKVTYRKGLVALNFQNLDFQDITVVNDFVYRLTRKQEQIGCNTGKIQMEQLLKI